MSKQTSKNTDDCKKRLIELVDGINNRCILEYLCTFIELFLKERGGING